MLKHSQYPAIWEMTHSQVLRIYLHTSLTVCLSLKPSHQHLRNSVDTSPHTLTFIYLFLIGRLSKWVWERQDTHLHIRLSHMEEFFFYIKFHVKPKLMTILNEHPHSKLFLWIATCMTFQHGQKLDEFCTRYQLHLTNYIDQFCRRWLNKFIDQPVILSPNIVTHPPTHQPNHWPI